jgi:hypothetical protein
MIIEIISGMLPFLMIFLSFCVALSLTYTALRDETFVNSWQLSYRLA